MFGNGVSGKQQIQRNIIAGMVLMHFKARANNGAV